MDITGGEPPTRLLSDGSKCARGIPEHSHEYGEWAMVIEGEIELTVEGKTKNMKKGDEWLTHAQAKHKWKSLKKSRLIGLFSERTRYRPKAIT